MRVQLEQAEDIARRAAAIDPMNSNVRHTLASILQRKEILMSEASFGDVAA